MYTVAALFRIRSLFDSGIHKTVKHGYIRMVNLPDTREDNAQEPATNFLNLKSLAHALQAKLLLSL